MNHGHHGIHFFKQSKIELVRKSLKRMSNFILPKWFIFLCETIVVPSVLICLVISMDRGLFNCICQLSLSMGFSPGFPNIMSRLSISDIMSNSLDFLALAFCLLVEGTNVSIGQIFELSQ